MNVWYALSDTRLGQAYHFVESQRWTGWNEPVPHDLDYLLGYGALEKVKILSDEELAVYTANAPAAPPPVATTSATDDKYVLTLCLCTI